MIEAWVKRIKEAENLKAKRAALVYMLDVMVGRPEKSLAILEQIDDILRLYAVERTKDQGLLKEIACSDFSVMARRVAVRRLEDKDTLLEVAGSDPEREVRITAIERLRELGETVNASLLLNKPARTKTVDDSDDRKKGGKKDKGDLTLDQEVLKRKSLVERSSNKEFLVDSALNDPHPEVRLAAMRRLEDPEILRTIAFSDEDDNVRGFAESRLKALGFSLHEDSEAESKVTAKQEEKTSPAPLKPGAQVRPDHAVKMGWIDSFLNKVLGGMLKFSARTKNRGNWFTRTTGRLLERVLGTVKIKSFDFQVDDPSRYDISLEQLAEIKRRFKRVLVSVVVILGIGIVAAGLYFRHHQERAQTFYLKGKRLLQQGEPTAVLWLAKAVEESPGNWDYRMAVAKSLLKRPNLVFMEAIPGAWRSVSLNSKGDLLAIDSKGRLKVLKGEPFVEVSAKLACWGKGEEIIYLDPDNVLNIKNKDEVKEVKLPDLPFIEMWMSESRLYLLSKIGLFMVEQGQCKPVLFTEFPVIDVSDSGRALSAENGAVRIWDVNKGKSVGLLPMASVGLPRSGAISEDGRRVLCVDKVGNAVVWEFGAGWGSVDLGKARWGDFSPDGRLLVLATVKGLEVWDPTGEHLMTQIYSGMGSVRKVMFSESSGVVAVLAGESILYGSSKILTPPETLLSDWDEPPELLELEAKLYCRSELFEGKPTPLKPAALKVLRRHWVEEAREHARYCQSPGGNLWNFYRKI